MRGEPGEINAGDEKVKMPVVVIVRPGAAAPVPGLADGDAVGDLGEGSVLVVVVENILLGSSVYYIITARDKKVDEAVVVVVAPGTGNCRSQVGYNAAAGDLGERRIDREYRLVARR